MARVAWVFTDLTNSTTYSLPINPRDDGSLQYEKQITYKNTSAPNGKTLIFEGQDQPHNASASGTLLTQAQYDAFVTWFTKRHQIQIVDDLGRTMVVYITAFKPKRKLSRSFPWRHEYTFDYVILNWS